MLSKKEGSLIQMKKVTLLVPEYLFDFYEKVGKTAGGLSPEKVTSDALFKLAGELSFNAIYKEK